MKKIEWEDYFLGLAFCIAQRSSDSQTKHGCVLVDTKTHQILSVGYNGFPRKCKDDSKIPTVRPNKHRWMAHSEQNCILSCRLKSEQMTVYITGQCCPTCLLSLYQFGVTNVVMADSHGSYLIGEDDLKWEKEFVEQTGITLRRVKPNLGWLQSVLAGRASEFIQKENYNSVKPIKVCITDLPKHSSGFQRRYIDDFLSKDIKQVVELSGIYYLIVDAFYGHCQDYPSGFYVLLQPVFVM